MADKSSSNINSWIADAVLDVWISLLQDFKKRPLFKREMITILNESMDAKIEIRINCE